MVSINNIQIQAITDTWATVNVMDTWTLRKLIPHPVVQPTNARIYLLGSRTPLAVIGVINSTVATGDAEVKTTFQVTRKSTGALLGCGSAEALNMVHFAAQVQKEQAIP